jgi:hypothetical protein
MNPTVMMISVSTGTRLFDIPAVAFTAYVVEVNGDLILILKQISLSGYWVAH